MMVTLLDMTKPQTFWGWYCHSCKLVWYIMTLPTVCQLQSETQVKFSTPSRHPICYSCQHVQSNLVITWHTAWWTEYAYMHRKLNIIDNGLVSRHYLNQYCEIVNSNLRNKFQWKLKWNSYIFIQENAFENVVWKVAAILSRPQCVKFWTH